MYSTVCQLNSIISYSLILFFIDSLFYSFIPLFIPETCSWPVTFPLI